MKKPEKNLASKTEVHNVLDLEKIYIKKNFKILIQVLQIFC